jgi:hypothetical protein
MNLEYVPLLQIQRDIQEMPRGMDRFRHYLRTVGAKDSPTLELPTLLIMNPMGKDHVTRHLDALLAMNAENIAADAVHEAAGQVTMIPGDFKIGLVIADDAGGGWTNRCDYEFTLRFPRGRTGPTARDLPRWLKHFWIHAVLWSSEAPTETAVREAILTTIFRAAYLAKHDFPNTLRDMLTQEGDVLARAGCSGPVLDAAELAATRAILQPLLDAVDKRTVIECMFGDEPASTLGFTPRGLRPWAGIALALHDSQNYVPPLSGLPISQW